MTAMLTAAPDFSDMTKSQLVDYAHEHEVSGVNSRMTKAAILEVLENA